MPDVIPIVKPNIVSNRADIDRIKSEFNPDITLFRGWVTTENLINDSEVYWNQEIHPTDHKGNKSNNNPVPNAARIIAYQSKPMAKNKGGYWMPYCVSKYWGISSNVKRDIPVMVAMSIPGEGTGMKIEACDSLVKPIIEWDSKLVHVFSGIGGGLGRVSYLKPCLKPSFPAIDAIHTISKAQIYLSPSTIWHDEGCISHKTIEAMGCGCLVITNKYIGMEDMFGADGENLLYSNSPEETLDKVKYYLKHDKEREEIAERGYKFIHSEYNWEKHLTRLSKELN